VIVLSANARIFLYRQHTDMRKGFEGLSSMVYSIFQMDVTCGAYFVFLNRRRDRMKVLYWDGDGLALWYKRLEKGSFPLPKGTDFLERRQFFMLLEGVVPQSVQKRYKVS